jgi:urease accessory protein
LSATTHIASLAGWLLPLLRFTSPTLPVGAYAYSRGLEYAVHAEWVRDEASALDWILGLLQHSAAQLDAPVFLRLYAAHAAGDEVSVARWNRLLWASRESAELRLEDSQLGAALARLLAKQGLARAQPWAAGSDTCYASMFALAAAESGIPQEPALLGFLWALAESQISAAVRLIPLGQSAGQRMLAALSGALPELAARARAVGDAEIGALAPGLAIASALHETQYTRLFRS